MLYKLVSTEGEQTFELKSGVTLVVGRALNSDIPVFDPTISRRHAEVHCDANGVSVKDLGSSNGTFLNGAKIDSSKVAPGDVVTFGKVAFRLKEMAPTPMEMPMSPPPAAKPGATIVRQVPLRDSKGILGGGTMAAALGLADLKKKSTPADNAVVDRNAQKLSTLLEVSKGLSRAIPIDEMLEEIVKYCFQVFDVDRVSILLGDEKSDLVTKISHNKKGKITGGASVPQSIARKAVEEKSVILSDNAGEDQRFGGQSILMQQVRSAICAPLIGSENRVLGVLYVDNLTTAHRFTDDDMEFLSAFSGIAAVAVENSQFAQRIQQEAMIRSNFERYFAPSLAARIAGSPDAVKLGGDKRPVAVLFSDIRGFTALSETMNPDDMAHLLTEYFTEMVECVFTHGGTLDKFIGDAVMAQWGAPLGEPDDADRAMQSAIEMIRELDKLNLKWKDEGRPGLQIGIGLNYGEAFAGNIGSERRLEYTVIGDTVNTASRLCSAAGPREILISDEFRRVLRNPPKLTQQAPMELKGKSQPVPVYLVEL